MIPTLRTLPVLAALALAACEAPPGGAAPPTEAPPALPGPADDTCGASGLANLIGQDASLLDVARFSSPIRVIRPGDMVTMDFNPQRLNVELDEAGTIQRIRCG